MSSDPLFSVLETWVAQGGLRPLDLAFAGFLKEQQPGAADLVLLAAVLVSHQLGRGHVCLDLNAAVDQFRGGVALLHDGEPGEQLPGLPAGLREGVTAEAWARGLGESEGPGLAQRQLPAPSVREGYYRDIVTLAYPVIRTPGAQRRETLPAALLALFPTGG